MPKPTRYCERVIGYADNGVDRAGKLRAARDLLLQKRLASSLARIP